MKNVYVQQIRFFLLLFFFGGAVCQTLRDHPREAAEWTEGSA